MRTPHETTSPGTTLAAHHVYKRYDGVDAVADVSFEVRAGEVHCLLGDNGAGKSTLIKVLSGVVQPTAGELLLNGQAVTFTNPRAAREAGIATVHQSGGMIPLMNVARNFVLGAEPTRGARGIKRLDHKTAERIAVGQLAELGLTRIRDGNQIVGSLSGGERQAIAIARALYFGAKVLILDEPTSALGVKQAGMVLKLVARARDRGVGVVFITHNARHALAIGDAFTVLIHGRVAAAFRRGEKTREEVLDLMAGGEEMEELELDLDL